MKKILLALSLMPSLLSAHTLPELFEALKHHAQTRADEMTVQKAQIAKEAADAKLYPTVDLFGRYDNYSVPTGLLPVPPNVMFPMIKDQSIPQPFAYNIYRLGASVSMPIFVKSIFTYAEKAEAMARSAQAKKRINRLKNEAVIVGSNANFLYLNALEKSLDGKERSLKETQKTLKIKVDNGRAPASALYKVSDSLNQVAIAKNSIALQRRQVGDETGGGVVRVEGSRLVAQKRVLHETLFKTRLLGFELQTYKRWDGGAEDGHPPLDVHDLEPDALQVLNGHPTSKGMARLLVAQVPVRLIGHPVQQGELVMADDLVDHDVRVQ